MRILHEPGAGELADLVGIGNWRDGREQPGVLPLGRERLDHSRTVTRRDHDISLRCGHHALDSSIVDRVRQGDDAPERGALVTLECPLVRVGQRAGDSRPTGVGVLDDRHRGLAEGGREIVGETPRRVGVEEVEVAEGQAPVLLHVIPPRRAAHLAVAGASLVRVLAVAEVLYPFEGEVQRGRQRITRHVVEPRDDRRVVGRGVREGLSSERSLGGVGEHTTRFQLFDDELIVGWVGKDADVFEVLGRRPDHGGSADVDELLRSCGAVLERRGIGTKGIEVGHHEVDRIDAVGGHVCLMIRVAPVGEDPAVHLRVQGDDAVAEDCREPGEVGHVGNREVGIAQGLGGAAAGDQVPPHASKLTGEVDDAGLVVDGEEGAHRAVTSLSGGGKGRRGPPGWCRGRDAAPHA